MLTPTFGNLLFNPVTFVRSGNCATACERMQCENSRARELPEPDKAGEPEDEVDCAVVPNCAT